MRGVVATLSAVNVDDKMRRTSKRGQAADPADAAVVGSPPKRVQKNVLGTVAADVAASFSNTRDILGVTDEQLTWAPQRLPGLLDAVREFCSCISMIENIGDDITVPQRHQLRGWVECCTFIETACRAQPAAVADMVASLCQDQSKLLDGAMRVCREPLLRWTCNSLGIAATAEEEEESLRAKIAARVSGDKEAVPAAAADSANTDMVIDVSGEEPNGTTSASCALEGGEDDDEKTEDGGDHSDNVIVAEEIAPAACEQVLPAGSSADVLWLVPHEEVARASGELNLAEKGLDEEAVIIRCASSTPCHHAHHHAHHDLTAATTFAMSQEAGRDVAGAHARGY